MKIDKQLVAEIVQRALHQYLMYQVKNGQASWCPAGMTYDEAGKLCRGNQPVPVYTRVDYEGYLDLEEIGLQAAHEIERADWPPCPTCVNGVPEPYGCADCQNTQLANGGPRD